ncbi:MAG: FHA domain-containing protein [Gemmataceae bacterium]|nr:FHA domain-containing protein [Gemmataceae bacterium]
MSFRLFVYYCALIGAWAAFFGWLLGMLLAPGSPGSLARNGFIGMFLGLSVALGLGLVDALWVVPWNRLGLILLRLLVAVTLGAIGGLISGMFGHWLVAVFQRDDVFIVAWTIVGLLCGVSVGCFDFLAGLARGKDQKGARSKLFKCVLGGTVGGICGAGLVLACRAGLAALFSDKNTSLLRSPTAVGFVALGGCIGLLVGLAQVILKEAWIRVEQGFRAGREMILAKEKTTIGRAEGNDIGLFGDQGVEKQHAQILLIDGRYVLEDNQTAGGSFVNDKRVNGRTTLQSGDVIRLGKSVLRFYEKQKRRPDA